MGQDRPERTTPWAWRKICRGPAVEQAADGGFPAYSTYNGSTSDANSTALSILGLLAAGENLANWEKGGVDPVKRLLEFQNRDGSFRYSDE